MRKTGWITTAVLAVLVAGGAVPAFADDAAPATAPAATSAVKHQTTCPVMGNEINKQIFVDFDGKRIYVCCPMCLPKLKADPAKYVKQMEAQGITLDKAETPVAPPAPKAAPKAE